MAFKMIRDLTWQTLTMVASVWAIAGYLGDIETNFAAPSHAHDGVRTEYAEDGDAPVIPRTVRLPRGAADRDCRSFDSQADAQAYMEETDGDPHRLDGDNDGVACERLN